MLSFFVFFFGGGGGWGRGQKTYNSIFRKTNVFNQIFNRVIVWVWTEWCTGLKKTLKKLKLPRKQNFYEFLKNRIFRKLTTDFENCTRLQAETRNVLFLDVEHNAIPHRVSSVHFATGNFHPFRILPGWVQKFEIWITRKCFEAHQFMVQTH